MNRRYGLGLEVAYLKADQNTMTLEALEGAEGREAQYSLGYKPGRNPATSESLVVTNAAISPVQRRKSVWIKYHLNIKFKSA